MKRLILLCILSSFIFLESCKKHKHTAIPEEPTSTTPAVTYPSYSAVKVGNYWIYENFIGDDDSTSQGNPGQIDSTYVSKDTLIHGATFFKYITKDLVSQMNTVSYLRDSLHYLINPYGSILFSSEDFTTVFKTIYQTDPYNMQDTLYKNELKMAERDLSFIVPAGTFTTSDARIKTTYYPGNSPNSQQNTFYIHNKYAKGVGLVFQSYPFATGNKILGKRLIRYHVN